MFRAFNTAISGLQANQLRMEVIGNNIANVNTTAFKGSRATFEEQFAQTMRGATAPGGTRGGLNPSQVGLGTRLTSIDTIHTQGALLTTGKNTDIAIQGKGYLVVKGLSGERLYTRDGNLGLDAASNLVTSTGMIVQGYVADQSGAVNTDTAIANLSIEADRTFPPKSTTQVDVVGNMFRPSRLSADEAFTNSQQGTVDSTALITAFGPAANQLQLGLVTTNSLEAGEFTINNISIMGQLPLVPGDSTMTVMQKMSDLINFHRDKTGVVATVKNGVPGVTPQGQIVLTSLKPGSNQQITVGGADLPNITLNGSQLFSAGTTTIDTLSSNTIGQATTGATLLASGDIVINGLDIGPLATTPTTNTSEQNAQALISLINAKTDDTGVTAFTDGNGRISLRATARDIILSGRSVAVGNLPTDTTPGGGANISGLFTGMNRAKTATVLAGTTTDVFDALGTKHNVGMEFIHDYDVVRDAATGIVLGTQDKGTWNWAASSGEADIAVLSSDGNAAGTNVPLRSVSFSDTGRLQNFSGQFTLNFLNSDAVTSNSIFSFNTNLSPNIARPQAMTVDVGTISDTNGITQFDGPQTLSVATQDGYTAGDLASFSIGQDGAIKGLFSNGQLLTLGQIALASFINEDGLISGQQSGSGGGNVFQETANSGNPRIGAALAGGNGAILGGALESSNVDMAEQFTDMIVTQRAFQANSRTITTADEMLQEILSLRR